MKKTISRMFLRILCFLTHSRKPFIRGTLRLGSRSTKISKILSQGYPPSRENSIKPKLCTFLKPDDLPCRAFALAGSALCHAHKRLQARQRRQYKALMPPAIRLGPLTDQLSIHRALVRVLRVIAANSIPLERSSALFYRVMRAMAQCNRAAALPALPNAHSLNHETRTSNLGSFALTPARLYNQPNPPRLHQQPATNNQQPAT